MSAPCAREAGRLDRPDRKASASSRPLHAVDSVVLGGSEVRQRPDRQLAINRQEVWADAIDRHSILNTAQSLVRIGLAVIPDDVRRFVLACMASVPHLEALLLFHRSPHVELTLAQVAAALYLPESRVGGLLEVLVVLGAVVACPDPGPQRFRYAPRDAEMRVLIERLSATYSTDMIEMTKLIHDGTNKSAQRFADAFKLRKDG